MELECVVCKGEDETTAHVLLTCPFVRAVWFSSPFGLLVSRSVSLGLKDWLLAVLETKEVDFDLACVIMWGIWQEKNSRVWRGAQVLPMVVWQKVSSWLSVFQVANCAPARVGVVPTSRWSPPGQGWVKVNTDGAVKGPTNMGGIEVVVRYGMGCKLRRCRNLNRS